MHAAYCITTYPICIILTLIALPLTSSLLPCSDTSFQTTMDMSMDDCCCNDSCDECEDETGRPTKRLAIHEANVSRYNHEFLELSLIGQGEFGSVYKCRHRLDGCVYAIKKSLKPVAGSVNG